ncbi:phospholipase D family protein [Polymorphobacter sp.]|uniref:phospholipase D family protein n=1 Tax=Polymorphobacter sp. TaxID=1909290 RepID=UPI003F701C92
MSIWVPDGGVRGGKLGPGFPPRDGNAAAPLILACEMYPALERLALDAESTLFLAFRVFDPTTKTRSDEALALGLNDWTALIRHTVERGVIVRLLLTDFEPAFADQLHSASWRTFKVLREMAEHLSEDALERMEMMIVQHPGEVGWALRQLLRIPAGLGMRKALARLAGLDEDDPLSVRPGLWRYARDLRGTARYRRGGAPRLWPATLHHKFAVADARRGIIGGIDVNERRWETPAYDQPADESWHDISLAVDGPVAGDMAEHFRRLWNDALPRYREITKFWMTGAERELTVEPLDDMPEPFTPPPAVGKGKMQLLRTLSRRNRQPFASGPRREVRELMAAHRQLILSARDVLYIEAQFFRSRRAASWVVQAARRSSSLQIIIVLPQAPEEVAFDGGGNNPAHRHGEWQQSRALGYLRKRLGARVGLYALGRRKSLEPEEREFIATRGTAFGAGMIYVHAKLLIADDRAALVSSANMNGRSFSWDSELGVLWEQPDAVQAFRQRLWQQLLGEDLPLENAGARWREIAEANVALAPEDRQGFVLPYRYARVRRFGRPSWFVPDDLV